MLKPSTETTLDLPILTESSDHSITIKVVRQEANHVPNLKISFIMDPIDNRVQSAYACLTDLPQNSLKEYMVDEASCVYFDSNTKKVSAFLIKNESFLPKEKDIETSQKEFFSVLSASNSPWLIQAYRLLCHYWVVFDAGSAYALGKVVMAVEDPNEDPEITD
jgi:hypothetical protein